MADPRGFNDTLAPVRQRAQWQLDEALAKLAGLCTQLGAARHTLTALEQRAREQAAHAGNAWRTRVDPSLQTRALHFLARVHGEQAAARLRIAELEQHESAARAESVKRQARLESLQRHRDEALGHFIQEQQRKDSVRADDDWLTRNPVTPRRSPP
ncbi:hypothetical protein [Caenimonas koreensis]|uniref:hypothetical protein n=1 Tax=Caenimonas koreensis TaxID=367474 RepID=UPI0037850376